MTVEQVMASRIALRDKRSALKKDFTEVDEKLKKLEDQCEVWLLKRANELGVDSFKVDGVGTAYTAIDTKVACADWQKFGEWVIAQGDISALEQRVSKKFVLDYRKEHKGEIPPAISLIEETVINVRRATLPKTQGEQA